MPVQYEFALNKGLKPLVYQAFFCAASKRIGISFDFSTICLNIS
jgi:hypothetical protein